MRLALAVVGAMGCGRVGFGTVSATTADGGDASIDIDTGIPPGAIAYAGSLGGTLITMGSTISLTAHAAQAGDAVVVFFACSGSQMPATGAITGTGWTFTPVTNVFGSSVSQLWAQSFEAIAPDTATVQLTATWTGSQCNRGASVLVDEFANATFDGHAETTGSGNVSAMVGTTAANDAVWAGCYTGTSLVSVGAGYTKAADDGNGDWAEYKVTTDPAGTTETAAFSNGAQPWALAAVTLKPN